VGGREARLELATIRRDAGRHPNLPGRPLKPGIEAMDSPEEPRPGTSKSASSPEAPATRWRRWSRACRSHVGRTILAGLALVSLLALLFADALVAGPMRTWVERKVNSQLDGYTIRLSRVHPHLWRLAFELEGLVLVQDTHPEPAVGEFAVLEFSVDLGELLRFRLVGDLVMVRPALHVNLAQLEEEAYRAANLHERGWQKALESIFPIKLDRVEVRDGSLRYLSGGAASKPIQLTSISMLARNVRNVAAVKGTFPSPVTLEAVVFDTGKVSFKGAADFLREPHAAGRGELSLEQVPLERLDPIARQFQVRTSGGLLSVKGSIEYTPEAQTAHLTSVLLEDLQVDYVTSLATRVIEEERLRQALEVAGRVRNAPGLFLRVDALRLINAQLGFVSDASKPPYRLFMHGVELKLENLDNHPGQGRSSFHATGVFMEGGSTEFTGGFLASATPVDFDVRLKVDVPRLSDLNPLLLDAMDVDVARGRLSLYTELAVKDGKVEGYIKPLFSGLKISDRKKDEGKPLVKRVEMHLLQFLAFVLKNHSTQEVATVIRVSGSTIDPQADEWEVIRRLIANGFARAVLPGFLDEPAAARPPGSAAPRHP